MTGAISQHNFATAPKQPNFLPHIMPVDSRAEKRHFILPRDSLGGKSIKAEPNAKTRPSLYGQDYVAQNSLPIAIKQEPRRILPKDAAGEVQTKAIQHTLSTFASLGFEHANPHEIDRTLYQSTYQSNYHHGRNSNEDDNATRPYRRPTKNLCLQSLYDQSYKVPRHWTNPHINPDLSRGYKDLLEVQDTTGLSVKDVIEDRSHPTRKATSYTNDFKPPMGGPAERITLAQYRSQFCPVNALAIERYRNWANQ